MPNFLANLGTFAIFMLNLSYFEEPIGNFDSTLVITYKCMCTTWGRSLNTRNSSTRYKITTNGNPMVLPWYLVLWTMMADVRDFLHGNSSRDG